MKGIFNSCLLLLAGYCFGGIQCVGVACCVLLCFSVLSELIN